MTGIMVGFDGSKGAYQALAWAADEAGIQSCDLHVVQSWHEPAFGGPGAVACYEIDALVQGAKDGLDATIRTVQEAHPDTSVYSTLADGPAAKAVLEHAEDAGLVVVGARGAGGFLGLELGSVSSRVARRSPVPVVVVRGEHDRRSKDEVVVGVDGSLCGRRALAWAADWARKHDKTLVAVLAWSYLEPQGIHGGEPMRSDYLASDATHVLSTILAEVLGRSHGIRFIEETACDLPARAILERAGDACLVVVGRHGTPHWAPPELGAVAQQVLHHATCPVAVIPDGAGPHDRRGD